MTKYYHWDYSGITKSCPWDYIGISLGYYTETTGITANYWDYCWVIGFTVVLKQDKTYVFNNVCFLEDIDETMRLQNIDIGITNFTGLRSKEYLV